MTLLLFHSVHAGQILPTASHTFLLRGPPLPQSSLSFPSGRLGGQGAHDPCYLPSPRDCRELVHRPSDGIPTVGTCLITAALPAVSPLPIRYLVQMSFLLSVCSVESYTKTFACILLCR